MGKIDLLLDRISKSQYNTPLTENKLNPKRCMVYQFACFNGKEDEEDPTPSYFHEYRIEDFNFTTLGLKCSKARSTGCKARISLSTKNPALKVVAIEDETTQVQNETTGSPKRKKKKYDWADETDESLIMNKHLYSIEPHHCRDRWCIPRCTRTHTCNASYDYDRSCWREYRSKLRNLKVQNPNQTAGSIITNTEIKKIEDLRGNLFIGKFIGIGF